MEVLTIKTVLIAIFTLSLLTFIALFGQLPALRRTPIASLQRALCIHLPNAFQYIDKRLTGGRLTGKSKRLGRYLFYERNPVVLILFLTLLTASIILLLKASLRRLPIHLIFPLPILVFLPYYFTYASATYTAHFITASNVSTRLKDYPYDHILFRPHTYCRTCNHPKPARSKHCSLCNHCIAQCDHHCPWVNNCLGRGNYRYFLALLLTLGLLQCYGAYLAYWILSPRIHPPSRDGSHGRMYGQDLGEYFHALVYAMNKGGLSIAGVGLLAVTTAAMPLGLLAYHCYLIWAGMTTNESEKWADWRDDMADGCVFRASRRQLRTHNRLRKYGDGSNGRQAAATASGTASLALGYDPDSDSENEVEVRWPARSDQVIIRMDDGKPPQGQEALWTRIRSLDDVENIYDLGGWRNLMEVLKGR